MKLASYIHHGRKSYGIYTEAGIIDLGQKIGQQYPTLKDLLQWDALDVAQQYVDYPADITDKDITFLPVIEEPGKIFCVGMNYAEKRKEFAETNNAPTLFIRFPDSQTGHARPVIKPNLTEEFDYEGELAVIIGKAGENIHRQDALNHVAGYSCYMDGSVRDWQHAWFTAGKNWRQTGAFGPYMTTVDEIPDPHALSIQTWLNGMLVQNDSTASMIHKVADLISYISTFTMLSPGDVIITGSPGGVGKKRNPPLFMHEGDCVEVAIEKLGRLTNTIVESTSPANSFSI
ncbi:Homoprotocatechuate catabolism bifunctional isomerase/decarboxylase [Phytobacter ursingii]|jgi:2-keto-4-pentenoate hydratase/2-oxohepta-3-ene-1,7-dioic acid hydratase in catechol pathway|uniref:Fumarylacetoacetate hydrolase family protein n=2 Tax=Enterobacteriaceae TaxID=543 RepID=A0AB35RQ45_9ENTR|nr:MULTISPECIES: fumarylacetoacetate hydrolase family protein [Enterobacteriaceae]MDU6683678.1 fumarylacetoacetate hydrolase family protein [Enterobacteriaceae bacterium]MCL9672216.1 fumarylacetoacetate hydrolase family protein [Citrobacter sp. MNAZ 1397]MDV2862172.1 fumarylacetoacetate hydrolase family protein [Phytobacter ursingii]ORJ51160.1 5-oxopent-3-ene-1,2,5-tricarboxylate decarboxylase [Kluyvera intermedia]VTP15209.1 Homoprotocatechuate catabolism bifunctional isomerase/decarboxylase [